MTDAYDRLVARLAQLHTAAVASSEPPMPDVAANLRSRLLRAMKSTQPSQDMGASPVDKPGPRALFPHRWTLTVVVPVLALLVSSTVILWKSAPRIDIRPEPKAAVPKSAPPAGVSSQPASNPPDPCVRGLRASGGDPLIDDFEDNNPLLAALEGRVGLWGIYKDTDTPGANSSVSPTLRPQPTRTNRYALHAAGGELRNWGATIQFNFTPSCYDASAYSGVMFSAKGPGRLYAGAREVRVIPVEYGGTCTKDCYNNHQKKIDLGPHWRTYSLKWSDMQQRGYNMPPLDPARINGLSFLIQAGDTPYDLWIDDVKFMSRQQPD